MGRRAPYQVVRDARGRVKAYRKQVVHPLTGQRFELRGVDPVEVLARAAELERIRRDLAAGTLRHGEFASRIARVRQPADGLTFRAVWERYLTGLHGAWRAKARGFGELRVLPALGHLTVHELTAEVMQRWASELEEKGLNRKTVVNYWQSIRAAVRACIDAEQLPRFPWGSWTIRAPKGTRRGVGAERGSANTAGEFARLLAAARRLDAATELAARELPDLTARVGLMSLLALRRGEAVALSWEDVHAMPDGTVEVDVRYQAPEGWRDGLRASELELARPRVAAPKGDSTRRIRFRSGSPGIALLEHQRALLQARGIYRPTGPVFPTREGWYRGRDVVRPEVMRRLARLAGLDTSVRWVQHSTRHTGATLAAGSARNPAEIQAFTGHRDVKTLSVYMHRASRTTAAAPELEAPELRALELGERAPLVPLVPLLEHRAEPAAALADEALEVDHEEAAARRRAHAEKFFARAVRDYSEAFGEWLDMGAPVRTRKGEGSWSFGLPRVVREAGEAAGKRAAEQARRAGASSDECARRARRARASAANGWHRWRLARVRELVAAGRGAELPEHVRAELERRGATQ